jgi:hypothetical protein
MASVFCYHKEVLPVDVIHRTCWSFQQFLYDTDMFAHDHRTNMSQVSPKKTAFVQSCTAAVCVGYPKLCYKHSLYSSYFASSDSHRSPVLKELHKVSRL